VKIEAGAPGKDFQAKVDLISVLGAGRTFVRVAACPELRSRAGPRGSRSAHRPGMTATARIAADKLPSGDAGPAETIFQKDGRPSSTA
jgi:hypothetical protein